MRKRPERPTEVRAFATVVQESNDDDRLRRNRR